MISTRSNIYSMLPIQEDCWRNIERSTHYGFKESFSELKWRRRRKKKKKKIEAIEAAAATEATFDSVRSDNVGFLLYF